MHQVYLVPGLLGFKNLGELGYFQGVGEVLEAALRDEHSIEARVVAVDTLATASLPRRAHHLLEEVRASDDDDVEAIHFIGHSTGGLDVRLLLTEGALLEGESVDAEIASRTRTALSLASPHFGTPLASHALQLNLHVLVAELAILATSRPLRARLSDAARSLVRAATLADRLGWVGSPLQWLAGVIGGRGGDGEEVHEYLREIADDQGALQQLTPAGTHLFNAVVRDRSGVRYVSFVTVVRDPRWLSSDIFFRYAHDIASRHDERYPVAELATDLADRITTEMDVVVDAGTNDGIVPTLSQLYGHVGGVVLGDHMDVVGLFRREGAAEHGWQPAWLTSGAEFSEARFEALWRAVAAQLALPADAPQPPAQIIV